MLTIIQAGPWTTLQDLGRYGYQHQGLTRGGAADEHAYRWANYLLNNKPSSSMLEICFGPFKAHFSQPTWLAISGARAHCNLNGNAMPQWQTVFCAKDSLLTLQPATRGLRLYLAIKGGFNVSLSFGSCSSVEREAIGFNQGANVHNQQRLHYSPSHLVALHSRSTPPMYQPNYLSPKDHSPQVLEYIPSYQYSEFQNASIQHFETQTFTISPHSNRMGYRLSGVSITPPSIHLNSEGIAFGSIQVPPDGNPIILLNDHPTIGGYPKLGCITFRSGSILSQLRPGQKIKFQATSLERVQKQRRSFIQFFDNSRS